MRAAVFHGPRDIRIEEVPEPIAGPGQVVIEVSRNGICGSDLHTYVGSSTGGAAGRACCCPGGGSFGLGGATR